jgi:hypothetical protein
MNRGITARLGESLDRFREEGVYKRFNYLSSPQSARVKMEGRGDVLILSSNNYLGLCDVPEVIDAGKQALDRFGAGTGSVRFICGTFTVHRELEELFVGVADHSAERGVDPHEHPGLVHYANADACDLEDGGEKVQLEVGVAGIHR